MAYVQPGSIVRLSVDELTGVSFTGRPSSISVTDAASGETSESGADGASFALSTSEQPNILRVAWDNDGVAASAAISVVQSHYCTLDDVRDYRRDEYQNGVADDESVFAARSRAESVIDNETRRHFIPVMEDCIVSCSGSRVSARTRVGGIPVHDITACKSASFKPLYDGADLLMPMEYDLPPYAQFPIVSGLPFVPQEIRDATVALAAWFLAPKAEPDNATSMTSDMGTVNFVVSGINGATSLPEVNAAIKRYGRIDYAIG